MTVTSTVNGAALMISLLSIQRQAKRLETFPGSGKTKLKPVLAQQKQPCQIGQRERLRIALFSCANGSI
jgi:hypothetical protein